MLYTVIRTSQFKKDWRQCVRRGLPMDKVQEVITILATGGTLPPKYKAHRLVGNRQGQWECHIEPDWLLVWKRNDRELTLLLLNTGTHAGIFGE